MGSLAAPIRQPSMLRLSAEWSVRALWMRHPAWAKRFRPVWMPQPGRPAVARQPFAGQSIVVTGTLEHLSRDQAEAMIRALGGKPAGSVSGRTAFVVAGENAGSKLTKARSLGISVLAEADFFNKIGN